MTSGNPQCPSSDVGRQAVLTIDDRPVKVAPGASLFEAAAGAGIDIPRLCHLPGRGKSSHPCLLCTVEVEGKGRARACQTEAVEGMVVLTQTAGLEAYRRERLETMALTHYGDCRAPCSLTCPGGINVQGYVSLVARGEYGAALRLIREKNPLPVAVGRVCPRFCETRCRRALLDEPVAINHLKRFLAEHAAENGFQDEAPALPTGHRVAIIGGGPAGLSAAYYLRKRGHDVTIFEAMEKLGGMLRYGIPRFRLPKRPLEQEIQGIVDMGVRVRIGKRWGRDFTLQDLRDQGYEATFIGIGLWQQRPLEIEGGGLAVEGLELLRRINDGEKPDLGQRVLVVGGGDIAVDAARSARRLGAEEVTVVYPRSRVEMPASQREIAEAAKEGVQFFLMATPIRLLPNNGKKRIEMARTVLAGPDKNGIRRPVPVPGSRLFWDGDTVICALGQKGDDTFKAYGPLEASLKLTSRKTIKANPSTMKTSVAGVFTGGDVTTGARTVIQAVSAGRRAAEAIHEYLAGERIAQPEQRFNFTKGKRFEDVDLRNFDGYPIRLREAMPERHPGQRTEDFDEVELGFTEEMAKREAKRCLECGCAGLSKCTFRELCVRHGVNTAKAPSRLRLPVDTDHPLIAVDPNKCVACERCLRNCQFGGIDFVLGEPKGVSTDISISFNEDCVSCGACVDACPTGALAKKASLVPLFPGEAETVRSVCSYCGTGCSIDVSVRHDAILEIKAHQDSPPNYGNLCIKGRFGYGFYRHPDRLLRPLVREHREEPFREVSWEKALALAAGGFKRILERHGPCALGVLSSSRCENEANYLAQKLARVVFRTNNVDNCARVCHAPSVSGLRVALGSGAATNSLGEIEGAEVLLICGSNTTESHPVVGMMVRRAVDRGTRLIVIDPRRTEVAAMAAIWLPLRPGTNVPLINALVYVILAEGLENLAFIEARTEGLDSLRSHLAAFSPEAVAAVTGVPAGRIKEAARLYAGTEKGMILYGLGVTEHRGGTQGVMALANLALITGNVGRPHAGICPLRGQNNVQGSCDMGALPYVYLGYQDVSDQSARERIAGLWAADIPGERGLTEPEMYEAAREDRFKGMYCIGYDPVQTQANTHAVRQAFSQMDFVVVQDIFLTETAKTAHVVFPAACFYEKDGTFTNAERRVRRIRRVVPAPGDALPDWEIISRLAGAMGTSMVYHGPEKVMEEIAMCTPSMAGISYKRLDGQGLIWPCPHDGHPGTPILHQKVFTRGKGRFSALPFVPPEEAPDADYPLTLVTGRRLVHYNNGSMTRRCHGLRQIAPEETLEIHPMDASRLGVGDGELVNVRSRRGSLLVRARITERSQPGTVFLSFHFPESPTNQLTSSALDEIALTPEYKVCAVAISPAGALG
jgi:formate dehydrogenase major subunit